MAWIESHQSLGTHKKLIHFARLLGASRPTAVGHLHYLWWWALDNAPTGDLTGVEDDVISEASGYEHRLKSRRTSFVNNLVEAGWLTGSSGHYALHDWAEYAGKLIQKRQADAERKRVSRTRTSNGHPTDVPRTSSGRPTDVAGTVPNRTIYTPISPLGQNPDVAVLSRAWEADFGTITSAVAGNLTDALKEYGLEVCLRAFRIAKANDKTSWSYVQGILKNGAQEFGKKPPEPERERYNETPPVNDGHARLRPDIARAAKKAEEEAKADDAEEVPF